MGSNYNSKKAKEYRKQDASNKNGSPKIAQLTGEDTINSSFMVGNEEGLEARYMKQFEIPTPVISAPVEWQEADKSAESEY